MLVITATFRFIRFRKINAPRIVRCTTTCASPSLSGLPLILPALVVFKRQRKIKRASLARLAFQPHAPAMLENDLAGDVEWCQPLPSLTDKGGQKLFLPPSNCPAHRRSCQIPVCYDLRCCPTDAFGLER